jgi:hypothetical protein
MVEDTKGANRKRKSKDRQHNGLNKIDKGTNNDLQNTKQKTKDRPTRTTLKPGDVLRCSGKISSSCYTCDIRLIERVVVFGRVSYMLSLRVAVYQRCAFEFQREKNKARKHFQLNILP